MRLRVALAILALAGCMGIEPVHAEPAAPGPSALAPSTSVRPGAPSERRRAFVAVVGLAALVIGVSGLWLLVRSRRRAAETPLETPKAPALTEPPPSSATLPPPARTGPVVPVCPTCRAEYGPEAVYCSRDGNRLIPGGERGERGPTGGICPVCGQGFDPGVQSCPVHDEELVPAPLYDPAPTSAAASPKICPTCGVQYRNGSGFCGADGSALVTVN